MATHPRARAEGILTEEIGDDLLVYDETRDTAHRLNRTAAAVWRACDGKRTPAELVEVLRIAIGDIADEDLVLVTLDDLRGNGLVEDAPERDRETMRASRRQFIRRVGTVGAAAMALPIVHSISAPEPAAAQTGTSTSTSSPTFDGTTSSTSTSSFPTDASTSFSSSFR